MAKTPKQHPNDAASPLSGKRVLVGVCGGIAAYKVAALVSALAQAGASVRVIMTDAATKFVTPLTFQSLSGNPVLTSIWERDDRPDSQHIGLARWCELFIIAPASADMIAKIAHGMTDDILSLTASALPRNDEGKTLGTPVLIAPSMNEQMWLNPINQRNIATLHDLLGWSIVGPGDGWQACRTKGAGRMSEPAEILAAAAGLLKS
jgi:phosphopantothenoylcysteine decarboxylase/phosphopantothenate--cysteine ligase